MSWPSPPSAATRSAPSTAPPTPPPGQAEVLLTPDIFAPGFAAEAIRSADVVVIAVGPNFATRHNPGQP
jgi:hypothetical protein